MHYSCKLRFLSTGVRWGHVGRDKILIGVVLQSTPPSSWQRLCKCIQYQTAHPQYCADMTFSNLNSIQVGVCLPGRCTRQVFFFFLLEEALEENFGVFCLGIYFALYWPAAVACSPGLFAHVSGRGSPFTALKLGGRSPGYRYGLGRG